MDQERTHARNRRVTRRAVAVALLAATAATGAVFLIKQDARGASAAAAGGGTDAIIGGEDAPNDQFPWIVSLQSTDEESDDDSGARGDGVPGLVRVNGRVEERPAISSAGRSPRYPIKVHIVRIVPRH